MWEAIAVLIFFFFVMGGLGVVTRLVEGGRKHRLDIKREEARIAEAKAREFEITHKQAELAYREALLELERFDRRTGGGTGESPPGPGSTGLAAAPDDR
jgi:hypothetical protein